jgi:murein DD-endopeptidase MepM/ murein hydrolase activator NlpD
MRSSLLLTLLFGLALLLGSNTSWAETTAEMQAKIDKNKAEIAKIDEKIKSLNKVIAVTRAEKQTLASELQKLELARQKLQTDITLTEKKIGSASLVINKLGVEIKGTELDIGDRRTVISDLLSTINQKDRQSLLEILVSQETTGAAWEHLGQLETASRRLRENVELLRGSKVKLENQKGQKETEKKILTDLKTQLADQKKIADAAKAEKDRLLTETKSKEAVYQQQLAETKKRQQQVQAEINDIESKIKFTLDKNAIPKAGTTALDWPLAEVRITQYFGNTTFATRNPQIYKGNGHNGIDFGAPVGTKIFSPASGIVTGTGDTDPTCRGASYGKWILITHDNGLATVYGHLSLVKAQEGSRVAAGELIGYTGNTGMSTGPHLHFSVTAAGGVEVGYYKSQVKGCGTYRMPLAAWGSYMNPLSYLPEIPK